MSFYVQVAIIELVDTFLYIFRQKFAQRTCICYTGIMYSLKDLAEHLNTKHHLPVQENQIRDLRNIGYYHGFKGYRFIRKSSNKISFTSFSQIVDLNSFDMQLKGLIYPNLMFIENALKSYVLEATLAECQSEKLMEIYKTGLTYYKTFKAGTPDYKKEFKKRMDLEMKISSALIRDYMGGKSIPVHFYEKDKEIPIWATFESLTLGEFGTFYSCANKNIRDKVSSLLNLPTNLNSDGFLLRDIIFCLKDLRNAVAHNGIIFDTRFATSSVKNRLKRLIENEFSISNIDSNYIAFFIALISYILKQLGENKRAKKFINQYKTLQTSSLPPNTKIKIFGAQDITIIAKLLNNL